MLQPRIAPLLRGTLRKSSSVCLRCRTLPPRPLTPQLRQFTSARHLRLPANASQRPGLHDKPPPKASKDDEEDVFVPKPLGRPIGFSSPPKAGENMGVKQKKALQGTTMRERNLERRQGLVEEWGQNYFRDFKLVRKYRKGKVFLANPRIFKQHAALYFPNMHGGSLRKGTGEDTTPVLSGKVSVVRVYSSVWGEAQVQTFTGEKENENLHQLLSISRDVAQLVDVNIEENWMKAWVIKLFQYRLRKQRKEEDWGKYFVIRRGVSDRIRETIGLLNGRVGYVYLVDAQCKIRWAASGDAEGTEKDDLTRGLMRLIEEQRGHVVRPVKPKPMAKKPEDGAETVEGIPIPVPIVF